MAIIHFDQKIPENKNITDNNEIIFVITHV